MISRTAQMDKLLSLSRTRSINRISRIPLFSQRHAAVLGTTHHSITENESQAAVKNINNFQQIEVTNFYLFVDVSAQNAPNISRRFTLVCRFKDLAKRSIPVLALLVAALLAPTTPQLKESL